MRKKEILEVESVIDSSLGRINSRQWPFIVGLVAFHPKEIEGTTVTLEELEKLADFSREVQKYLQTIHQLKPYAVSIIVNPANERDLKFATVYGPSKLETIMDDPNGGNYGTHRFTFNEAMCNDMVKVIDGCRVIIL